jgi:hypothetical protein
MNELLNCGLGLLLIWVFFLTGMLIWNNPFTFQEVKEAEKDQNGPWPKDEHVGRS